MEAIYEFEVKDMPVTVAVDARGESVHETGPAEWRGNASRAFPVEDVPCEMTLDHAILLPPTALVLLTGFVWLRLGSDRLGEMRTRRIHPQQVATSKQMGETLQNVQSADHFRNLFEVPVLFYALCALSRDHQADDAVPAGVRVGLRRAARGCTRTFISPATRSCGAFRCSSRARSCCT